MRKQGKETQKRKQKKKLSKKKNNNIFLMKENFQELLCIFYKKNPHTFSFLFLFLYISAMALTINDKLQLLKMMQWK